MDITPIPGAYMMMPQCKVVGDRVGDEFFARLGPEFFVDEEYMLFDDEVTAALRTGLGDDGILPTANIISMAFHFFLIRIEELTGDDNPAGHVRLRHDRSGGGSFRG